MGLKFEPASEPLPISVKKFFSDGRRCWRRLGVWPCNVENGSNAGNVENGSNAGIEAILYIQCFISLRCVPEIVQMDVY
jgi:hypothetical protein